MSFKRSVSRDQVQPMFQKRVQTQDGPSVPKKKIDKRNGYQNDKPIGDTCGKKHTGECLFGTSSCIGFGKDGLM